MDLNSTTFPFPSSPTGSGNWGSKRSPRPVRTLLVDDQDLFREAIRTVLELDERFDIVGETGNGHDAVQLALQLRPDVVVMDLRMPGFSGIEATRRIFSAQPQIRILVLTTFDEEQDILAVLRNGATGYALKNLPAADLKSAILTVSAGGGYLHPSVTSLVLGEYRRLSFGQVETTAHSHLVAQLSLRERDLLRYLARGRSNKEMASELGITEGTVKNHLTSIFGKFQVQDRTAVALKARELGLC